MNILSFLVNGFLKLLKLRVGKESLQFVYGMLVEDNRFGFGQMKMYRNELKFELKFKLEKGKFSIYSIQI